MPIQGQSPGVSYSQMVEYVARVTDPMEAHMRTHDAWHLERLTTEQLAARANRVAMLSVYVALAAIVVSLLLAFLPHH